jgi:hypothetical protein
MHLQSSDNDSLHISAELVLSVQPDRGHCRKITCQGVCVCLYVSYVVPM